MKSRTASKTSGVIDTYKDPAPQEGKQQRSRNTRAQHATPGVDAPAMTGTCDGTARNNGQGFTMVST